MLSNVLISNPHSCLVLFPPWKVVIIELDMIYIYLQPHILRRGSPYSVSDHRIQSSEDQLKNRYIIRGHLHAR